MKTGNGTGAHLTNNLSKVSLMSGRRDDVGMDHFVTPEPVSGPMSDERREVRKVNTYDIENINPLENFVD